MSGNLPDGCDKNDPRFNEEDKPWAECNICGDGGEIKYHDIFGFCCLCETCGAEVSGEESLELCQRQFKEGYYTNVTPCPNCHAETIGLKIYTDIHGVRVACDCGVSGPYEQTIEAALTSWNNLF